MDIRHILLDLIHNPWNLQEFVNRRFQSQKRFILDIDVVDRVICKDGSKFYASPNMDTLNCVTREYQMDDIRPTDTVFDIGANIGGFTIRAALKAKRVVSVEPAMTSYLYKNIALSGLENITVYNLAVTNERELFVPWGNRVYKGIKFRDLLEAEGPCNFLKCDIEGGEKDVNPLDLINIRRIEMEIHDFKGNKEYFEKLMCVLTKTHNITFTNPSHTRYGIMHARKKE